MLLPFPVAVHWPKGQAELLDLTPVHPVDYLFLHAPAHAGKVDHAACSVWLPARHSEAGQQGRQQGFPRGRFH